MASPLLGYNTNVRHHGKVFHIQTEDSGTSHGHIFTHLFADGGRIIATKKSSYAHWIGTDRYPAVVKKLMQAQHKAMFIALRDGLFDADEVAGAKAFHEREIVLEDEPGATLGGAPPSKPVDPDELDRAAAAYLSNAPAYDPGDPAPPLAAPRPPSAPRMPAAAASPSRARLDPTGPVEGPPAARAARAPSQPASGASARQQSSGKYQQTQPAAAVRARQPAAKAPAEQSLFGADILSEKSLDEVIMSYLAEDLDEKE